MGLLWLLVSEVVGGLLLGFVFVQSHNGMEVYNDDKDFYTAQVCALFSPHLLICSPPLICPPPTTVLTCSPRSSLCPFLAEGGHVEPHSHRACTDVFSFFFFGPLEQVISTRDVKSPCFNNWLSGGLNRQIEHHLFPTLPRHSLKECTKLVAALCASMAWLDGDVDWKTGTGLVLRHLAKVAATA